MTERITYKMLKGKMESINEKLKELNIDFAYCFAESDLLGYKYPSEHDKSNALQDYIYATRGSTSMLYGCLNTVDKLLDAMVYNKNDKGGVKV